MSATLQDIAETIKQAHDESLDGNHQAARVMLRDAVQLLDELAKLRPIADSEDAAALNTSDGAIYSAASEAGSPEWHAGFKAGLDAGKACAMAMDGSSAPDGRE